MTELVRAIGEAVSAIREAPEGNRPPGVVYAKCVLKYSVSGAWAFGTAYILGKYNADPQQMINIFQKVALPAGLILMGMTSGCLQLSLRADSFSSLQELWKRYTQGVLQTDFSEALLTPDLLQFANANEELELEVEIDKSVYREACLDLMLHKVHNQSFQRESESLSLRRTLSDSNLILNTSKTSWEVVLRAATQAKDETQALKRKTHDEKTGASSSTAADTIDFQPAQDTRIHHSISSKVLKVTLLTDKWSPSTDTDSLSVINTQLAIQLAKHPNVEVTLLVPQNSLSEEDKKLAGLRNILTTEEVKPQGRKDELYKLSMAPEDLAIDIVISHGNVFDRKAQDIRETHRCKLVQLVHDPMEKLELLRHPPRTLKEFTSKTYSQKTLADLFVEIWSHNTTQFPLWMKQEREDLIQLTPGTFSDLSAEQQAVKEGNKFKVLTITEDVSLGGADVILQAMSTLVDKSYQLIYLVKENKSRRSQEFLFSSEYDISKRRFSVNLKDENLLKELLPEMDLVLIPSQEKEEFELTALQALSAGIPFLVSRDSIFAEALTKVPFGSSCIVHSDDPVPWAEAIKDVRKKSKLQRQREIKWLRKLYDEVYNWDEQVETLVGKMWKIGSGLKIHHLLFHHLCCCPTLQRGD